MPHVHIRWTKLKADGWPFFPFFYRNISNEGDDEIEKNLTSLKENGFINYFGTQRFGTNKDAPTHAVGRALLQADWEKVRIFAREEFHNDTRIKLLSGHTSNFYFRPYSGF